MNRWYAFWQLFLARLREFYREPEVLFWVYGFPLILAVGLGVAFWSGEPEPSVVDVEQSSAVPAGLVEHLRAARIKAEEHDEAECAERLRIGKTMLYVQVTPEGHYRYVFDKNRPESRLARYEVEDAVLRWKAGAVGAWKAE